MLNALITAHRAEIVARCRAVSSSGPAPVLTDTELETSVPRFLDQLTASLQLLIASDPTIGRCVDTAIAQVVAEHGRLREQREAERLGRLAHDLRNALNSAVMSFDMLGTCGGELGDSIAVVLGRSLAGLGQMIDRGLVEGPHETPGEQPVAAGHEG